MNDSDPMLAKAIERRETALREAASWDEWIKRYVDLRDHTQSLVNTPTVVVHPVKAPHSNPVNQQRPVVANTLRVARDFMGTEGRPIPISEMLAEALRQGVDVGGKSPTATLDGRLRYSKEFVNILGRGWWFKDRPVPRRENLVTSAIEAPVTQEDHPQAHSAFEDGGHGHPSRAEPG